MKNPNKVQTVRFHYSILMEAVTHEFFGVHKRPSGMATSFRSAKYVKGTYLSIVRKIEKRIRNVITTDEPLLRLLLEDLEMLKTDVAKISERNNNDLEIIANLFFFIAHLLGWAYLDGNFHRTPLFYQSEEEQEEALRSSPPVRMLPKGLAEAYYRRRIIEQLIAEGLPHSKIALVMRLSETAIKHLAKATYIDEMYEKFQS